MARKNVTLTMTVPAEVLVGTYNGKALYAHPADFPESILGEIFYNGMLRVLRDGVGGKESDDDKSAAIHKRLDSWKRGEWAIATRGAAVDTLIRELFRADMEKVTGPLTDKAFAQALADTVKAGGGKVPEKGGISAELLLTARAAILAKRDGGDESEIFDTLLGEYTARANALAAERAKAVSKVDVTSIDF